MIYFDRKFGERGFSWKEGREWKGREGQVNSLSRTCLPVLSMDNVLLAGSQRATPRVSRSSHDTHVERWIARVSGMASVYARERRPVPHSESVRTRFHISHNRLVAERGTVERSFLATPISPRPFWYPMWSLISPVCSGHILAARLEIELIFWYDLPIRSTFWGGHCFVRVRDLLNLKAVSCGGVSHD